MKTTTMQVAFAIMLAVAMLMGGSARVQEIQESVMIGESCDRTIASDAFDGKMAVAGCMDYTTRVRIAARCLNNTTDLIISTDKYMLQDRFRLRVALDGVETPEWHWIISSNNKGLFIFSAMITITEMLKHSRLEIRVIERDGDTHNADIGISRFGEAIAPVRELCGW